MNAPDRCSFCGKLKGDVLRLVAGGGNQPVGELPRVAICDECVRLCARMIAEPAASPTTLDWQLLLHRGQTFEWTVIPQPEEQTAAVVRRPSGKPEIGGVFEKGVEVTPARVQALIDQLLDKS